MTSTPTAAGPPATHRPGPSGAGRRAPVHRPVALRPVVLVVVLAVVLVVTPLLSLVQLAGPARAQVPRDDLGRLWADGRGAPERRPSGGLAPPAHPQHSTSGGPGLRTPRPGPTTPVPARGVWPLLPPPRVVAGFDPPAERWLPGHRGVDLPGGPGQPVRAALGGTVTFAGPLAGVGVVVVDHGGFRTTYQPVAASVAVGDLVVTGEVVGRLAMVGSHCLPRSCLHWGLRRGDAYEDPLTLVGGGPVRLLPLDGALRLTSRTGLGAPGSAAW